MVQELSISGQVSKIIAEKDTELLCVSKIPENLWPEAIQHAVGSRIEPQHVPYAKRRKNSI
jgi:hypothetical protein